ncbi:hypothetical protein [Microbispora triticiradicis]|uniref:Uncharacterized protein n=2 Tax=Microbispora TaxID=2005 RepID=A0ABY3LUV4_9ACTN|nr:MULTISPECIES: hypothetical protein [Microbispora]TLP62009.1 hypothetical protein FED44_08450 [Microbispora fusca]TYB56101.1 hypothetical protein FXF59_21095 [Microbispora tritici]GLW21736.1 hypothetical protein Mame01_17790 [Microbispora amethystogenes]
MAQHDEPYGQSRRGSLAGRLLMSVALAATGIGLSPAAAHADTWRTATGSAWGQTQSSASAAAQASARNALASLATQLGEVCTNVTSSATLVYVVPSGGGYQFNGTATGLCAPAPPPPSYTVPRTATARGEGSTPGTAQQNGAAGARAAILAAGGDCTGYQTTGVTNVYTTPTGSWYIYDVTVSALCVH